MKSHSGVRLTDLSDLECEVDKLVSTGNSHDDDQIEKEKEKSRDSDGIPPSPKPLIARKKDGRLYEEDQQNVGHHPDQRSKESWCEFELKNRSSRGHDLVPGSKPENEHAVERQAKVPDNAQCPRKMGMAAHAAQCGPSTVNR